jgi:predicted nucleic acid-binding protein
MILAAIPAGARVFVDANVFLYHFMPHPIFKQSCTDFLERIELLQLSGCTTANVISEVAHRLMTYECHQVHGWPMAGMGNRLRRHPQQVQLLTRYRQAIDEISLLGLQIFPVTGPLVSQAADFCRQFGILMNDGIIAATMHAQNVHEIASNDTDFDRVPGIQRFSPA